MSNKNLLTTENVGPKAAPQEGEADWPKPFEGDPAPEDAPEEPAPKPKAAAQGKAKPKRTVQVDIPEGKYAVLTDRGYNRAMHERIVNHEKGDVPVTVTARELVTINGVRFYVEGPEDGELMQTVLLPYPIAQLLRDSAASLRSADKEHRARTAVSLGGTLPDENRG